MKRIIYIVGEVPNSPLEIVKILLRQYESKAPAPIDYIYFNWDGSYTMRAPLDATTDYRMITSTEDTWHRYPRTGRSSRGQELILSSLPVNYRRVK